MKKKLIETAFPIKKVSEHSKSEKNISNGHISSLHRWPARRPLAASRAVLIASLLDDPEYADEEIKKEYKKVTGKDNPEEQRKKLCNMITKITKWKTESGPELEKFRNLIYKTYGKVPKLIDPFAGGGSIPLEAMRLGCDVTANDYNPVAAFILKCTLEFPQRFYNKKFPLPDLELDNTKTEYEKNIDNSINSNAGSLADHVELWGKWVLEQAKKEIGHFYPEIDGKKTVAYLWARTVPCQDPNCGGTVPLLKTLLLCNKKNGKLRALKLKPNKETKKVEFEIYTPKDKNDIQKPIISSANAKCPFCGTMITPDYIKKCGFDGKLKQQMTCVIYETDEGKEYRSPTKEEIEIAEKAENKLKELEKEIPFGIPDEPLPKPEILGMGIPLYGFKTWGDLFTDRQLLSIMTFVKYVRKAKEMMKEKGYDNDLITAVYSYLALVLNKLIDYNSTICIWQKNSEGIAPTFARYALPMSWDFAEVNPFSSFASDYNSHLKAMVKVVKNLSIGNKYKQVVLNLSSTDINLKGYDFCGVTDPPYYDAIPYSDISDFFYVWLKRIFKNGKEMKISNESLDGNEKFLLDNQVNDDLEKLFLKELTPKKKELVAYFKNNKKPEGFEDRLTKSEYEEGIANAFEIQSNILINGGVFVVVFANKKPDAWETFVNALLKANFTITASLPLDTEKGGGLRNNNRSSLSTSIWMVCRKRENKTGKGKHHQVLKEMKENITERLRYFWDEGVRGPDFVWSAIGPALESYSKYEIVKRPDGKEFTVSEFLTEVRRIVTDFALGEILKKESTEGVDVWTSYYLKHRYNFGYESAPADECILLSQAYGLDLNELSDKNYGILNKTNSKYTLLPYNKRNADKLGEAHTTGILSYIDMLHKLMIIWKSGDTSKLNEYISDNALKDNDLFWRIGQSVLEMCDSNKEQKERSLLESIVSWGKGSPIKHNDQQDLFNNI